MRLKKKIREKLPLVFFLITIAVMTTLVVKRFEYLEQQKSAIESEVQIAQS